MDGSAELLQLAHLLRIGARLAHGLGTIRERDRAAIVQLADQAELIAEEMEAIAKNKQGGAELRPH